MKNKVGFGSLVCSNSGHDKNKIYFVVKLENNFAFCCDGKTRTIKNPKKKNLKHLNSLNIAFNDLLEKHTKNKLYDYKIATIIKNSLTKCTNLNSHT